MATAKRQSEAAWVESTQRWRVSVQIDGERKSFYSSTPGKKGKHEAESKADEWAAGHQNTDRAFDVVWAEYLEYVKSNTSNSNYVKVETEGRKWLTPVLRKKKLSRITQMDWQECVAAPAKVGLSRRSCINVRMAASTFCSYCKKRRIEVERPEDITLPANAKVGKRKILQPGDIKTLFTTDWYLNNHGQHQPAFFIHAWRMIVVTGLRRGELCGLRKSDIEDNVVHVDRSVNTFNEITPGKNENANRYVVLSARAKTVLADQAEMLRSRGIISPWLFPDEMGEMLEPKRLYGKWASYRRHHGLTTSIHEMRHTFVSVVKADMPEQLLKAHIGHSDDMDTFGVYAQRVDGDIKRTGEIIDLVFNGILTPKQP